MFVAVRLARLSPVTAYSMSRLTPLSLLLLAATASAQTSAPPLTIEQAMADPDWIGPAVDQAWWGWNGHQVEYLLKRNGNQIRDTFRQSLDGQPATQVEAADRATLDAAEPVYDAQRQRMLFVRNGDVFMRDLRSGALTQLTRSNESEDQPQFATDGGAIWRAGNDWYHWNQASGTAQAAVIKAAADPHAAPASDVLREQQLNTLATLRNDRAQREALKQQAEAWRQADPSRAPAPAYLGDDVDIVDSALSPDGRHLLVVTQAKGADEGQTGKMPRYVTESGYEEFQEVRTRVGRNNPVPQSLWLVDVASAEAHKLDLSSLPGIDVDPLAALRKAAGKEPLKGLRAVRIESTGGNPVIQWSNDGRNVAVEIRAVDNKDRWIASVDLDKATLNNRHRLHDDAWINWSYNDFGWMPDNQTLWLLSEESGYSQLYTVAGNGKPKALTSGNWEASSPQLSADGSSFYFLCNQHWPGRYEICQVGANGGEVKQLTSLHGVEDFSVSPDGSQLLVRYSGAYLPPQLAVVPASGGDAKVLTDTRTAEFKAMQWVQPQYVEVPSSHGGGKIWGKYYGPANPEPGKQYPVVMFVHGAGYLQDVSERYTPYFREQMFNNLLVQQGYIVLDLDYRGSQGYGRNWRTAVYRNMGHPELEDYLDGLDWLAANHQGDKANAGIYGGSYGGFMTYMAMFRAPGAFKAGAALRPVADWMQYNHEYTSNILNTPDLDPEAYKRSSPINYAEGLQGHLLIAHGMVDDNVFFKDSVDMTQKLMELHKDNWQLAPYPLERHGFVRPDSWLDEYKRILKLFNEQLR